jgi:hypothetical protein
MIVGILQPRYRHHPGTQSSERQTRREKPGPVQGTDLDEHRELDKQVGS